MTTSKKIESIIDKLPILTKDNVRVFKDQANIQDHEYLMSHLEEFERACEWLKTIDKIKSFNRSNTSYGLKHIAERAMGNYISNDALIAAAIYSGFHIKLLENSPNVIFNMSKKSIKKFTHLV